MKSIRLVSMAALVAAIALTSCSGEDGERGPQGEKGEQGEQGAQGAQGEQGEQGAQGEPGKDSPGTDFYFQEGFKGYEGANDVTINQDESSNSTISQVSYDPLDENNNVYTLMRFDGISQTLADVLVDGDGTCADAFYINWATLYLYVTNFSMGDATSLHIRLGFYNESDPLFSEEDATWTIANQVDAWSNPGAESSEWAGPFQGGDNYTLAVPDGSLPGWVALPLPRSIVESWACNDGANKGFRLRLSHSGLTDAFVTTISSEHDATDFRPLLVIEAEKADTETAKDAMGSSKTQDWESLTYEEKMAPLYRFLETKNR